jgi:hypothetical protein
MNDRERPILGRIHWSPGAAEPIATRHEARFDDRRNLLALVQIRKAGDARGDRSGDAAAAAASTIHATFSVSPTASASPPKSRGGHNALIPTNMGC